MSNFSTILRLVASAASVFIGITEMSNLTGTSKASASTFSSAVTQSGFAGFDPYPITAPARPFDFTAQDYRLLTSITSLRFTTTIFDGDSASVSEGDFNTLNLLLNGIDTGIKLNGFPNQQTKTLTLSGVPTNADQLLSSLKVNGKVSANVLDTDAASRPPNYLAFPGSSKTTLEISGNVEAVPEPTTVLGSLIAIGMAGVAQHRRNKRSNR